MKNKMTRVTAIHYVKLVYRSLLLILGIALYIYSHVTGDGIDLGNFGLFSNGFDHISIFLAIVWIIYMVEMILRLFPSKNESMGCQKQFARNYEPTGKNPPKLVSSKRVLFTLLAWAGLNGIFGALYFFGVIDAGILFLISLAYGICDMICILFWCPFHVFFLQSRCCADCRIYNWDFAMMFTPYIFLVFTPSYHFLTVPLLFLSLVIFARWEITAKLHPERFSTKTNKCLSCANCPEKLCKHKKHLAYYLKKNKDRLFKD